MVPTRVIIVGCGVAGPVLATFLKSKGYQPVIYERIKAGSDGGISLLLQSNGLRVLGLIPGLLEQLPGHVEDRLAFFSTVTGHEALLGEHTLETPLDASGVAANTVNSIGMGIQRHEFLCLLAETALKAGVEIHWEHNVVDIQQRSDSVQVTFENGTTDTASFVVGCDGIHSNTRANLFQKEQASFTGLTQIGGFSPRPNSFPDNASMINYFGENTHMICYQIGHDRYSWAITRREAETKETWRAVDDTMLAELKKDPVSEWGFGAGELVKTAEKMVKFGLYDRPELATWYKNRVVLLGDAAHPTSPHLGQGANQALEDIYHLVRVLVQYNPLAQDPPTQTLVNAFEEYERIRLSRTSFLVKEARRMGETRVVNGTDACISRNEAIRGIWANTTVGLKNLAQMRSGPFDGQSEI
ncbi:FAD/NAD(P)-binding domain-containing protein [Gymnopus androsaceus JB14]|uniref:FAD/NAD(P)-binding domain-containing protein n=1 Tax=Gymnopus androsaceus JB14 TaxID=1447944 RepID=A0A6A4HLK0_9AGAR|nr:FAD/NAD(P)-binding domain-containing protein [Gymnopus androsaceus JB14]